MRSNTMMRRLVGAALGLTLAFTAVGVTSAGAAAAAADTKAPSAPRGLQAATPDQASISLSWQASTDNVGVTGYTVYRNGVEITSTTDTRLVLTGQPVNRTLYFQVVAFDAAGNRSVKTAPVTAATIVDLNPMAPKYLMVAQVGVPAEPGPATSVVLVVEQRTPDTDIAQYAVWRNGKEIAIQGAYDRPVGATIFLTQQPTSVPLWYQVQAIDRAGHRSVKTAPVSFCLCDLTAPSIPTQVVVTKQGTGVHITWAPSTDESSPQFPIRYIVRINGVPQHIDVPMSQAEILTRTALDFPNLPVGVPLSFDVVAIDHYFNTSAKSAPVTITL